MRTLLVTSMFPPYFGGGVSSHVRDLAESLAAMGHEAWVLTSRRGQPVNPEERSAVPHATRVVYAPTFRGMAARIGRLLRTVRFDVVHFHSFNALALAPWSRQAAGGATVFTLHSDSANYLASVRGWTSRYHPAYRAVLLYERIAARFPDMTIAVSNRMVDYARSIGIDRVVRIPNAVDTEFWRPGPGRGGNGRTILVPRMHVPKNGIEFAIDAIRNVRAAVPGATLLITGDGPLRGALEQRAAGAGKDAVHFLGMVSREEMRRLYQTSDLVMIPSITTAGTQENTSIAALEAMACSTPVVATGIGGLLEIIDSGRTGLLVPEQDASALADAAIGILQDDAALRAMQSQSRDHVVRDFSVTDWAEKVVDVYRRALPNGEEGAGRASG